MDLDQSSPNVNKQSESGKEKENSNVRDKEFVDDSGTLEKKRKISSSIRAFERKDEESGTCTIGQYCENKLLVAGSYGTTHLYRHVEGKYLNFKIKNQKILMVMLGNKF